MAKNKAMAGKAGKYGQQKDGLKKTKGGKNATGKPKSMKFKKKPGVYNKTLVPKAVMDALQENRKEKKEKRSKDFANKHDGKVSKKRKLKETKEPKEPLKKKELKKVRKAHDNEDYDNIVAIKKLWEKSRANDIESAKRIDLIIELKKLMIGKVESLMFKHDLARVVQMILKHGTTEHNSFIIEELKPHVLELAKSKYGKFTANCVLKYSTPNQRKDVFKIMSGHIKKLTLHSNAVTVVDTFYNDYATSKQRTEMVTEFYGKEFYLFRDLLSEHLSKVLDVHPDKRNVILKQLLKLTLIFIEKGLTGYIIVQHLMLQYFLHSSEDEIHELISEKLIQQTVSLVHTKEGSKIAMRCIWYGKAKDRKSIIKTFKGNVKEMAINENGYLVLCSVFDCVDDTVLVKKTIISEILENLDSIVMSQYGRNVINYLLQPRSKQCHPTIIKMLSVGDGNKISKKDKDLRSKELLSCISSGIIDNFSNNTDFLLLENATALLMCSAALNCDCDVSPLLEALVELASEDQEPCFPDSLTAHIVLRNLLQNKELQKQFSEMLISKIDLNIFKSWLSSNRGAFTLLRIVEHRSASNHQVLVNGLKSCDLKSYPESAGVKKLIEFLSQAE